MNEAGKVENSQSKLRKFPLDFSVVFSQIKGEVSKICPPRGTTCSDRDAWGTACNGGTPLSNMSWQTI